MFSAADGTFLRSWELPDGAAPTRVALTWDGAAAYVSSGFAAENKPFKLFKYSLRSTAADGSPRLLWSVDATGLSGLTVDNAGNAWSGDWAATVAKQYAAANGAVLQTIAVATPHPTIPTRVYGATNLAHNPRTDVLYAITFPGEVHMFGVGRATAVPLGTVRGWRQRVGARALALPCPWWPASLAAPVLPWHLLGPPTARARASRCGRS